MSHVPSLPPPPLLPLMLNRTSENKGVLNKHLSCLACVRYNHSIIKAYHSALKGSCCRGLAYGQRGRRLKEDPQRTWKTEPHNILTCGRPWPSACCYHRGSSGVTLRSTGTVKNTNTYDSSGHTFTLLHMTEITICDDITLTNLWN